LFPDFVPRHIYEYAYVTKSVQLHVSLRFYAPRYGFYFTIWVKTENRMKINKAEPFLSLLSDLIKNLSVQSVMGEGNIAPWPIIKAGKVAAAFEQGRHRFFHSLSNGRLVHTQRN
jgi:hypothetical protein